MTHAKVADIAPLFQSFERLKLCLEAFIEGKSVTATATELLPELTTLLQLGEQFQLSEFEQLIIVLGTALELEPNFRGLCEQAQGDRQKPYLTLGLVLAALPGAHWSVLSPQSPLHYWQLIRTDSQCSLTDSPIGLDPRILCYLLGQPALDTQLSDRMLPLAAAETDNLPSSYQQITQQLVDLWGNATAKGPLPLVKVLGTDGNVNSEIVASVCEQLGLQLMALPVAALPTDINELKQLQRCWEREAILSGSVLLLDGELGIKDAPHQQAAIAHFLETLSTPVIYSGRNSFGPLRRPMVTLEVPSLTHAEQTDLWHTHLGVTGAHEEINWNALAAQFKLTPTGIRSVCQQYQTDALKSSGTDKSPVETSQFHSHHRLWTLCRQQARPQLDDLAQRIEATATWEDLVLPDRQRQVLNDIATHLNYRARVYQDWGFAQKSDRGLGISALFYGESGTGKTMAAEVLAQACRLDLYRIDLSTVVSKYIGETEKNLRRIFDAAETGGVILLFDEADALFGKRTEVKDSHDRHANIEVSYLLQRMEAYQGLAILTSNLKDSLDKAFLRRLRFMVPFPFPDAEARAQIWQRIFPAQTPTQNLDYTRLGQLKIAGGNIRNIALNAAFLAAQADHPVTMGHIRQAAQRDYLKLEKLLTTEELKGWE
ncbi:MAG: ATP-binding protein [Leptolyngbya sp. SIO1D8]|nr:ATP-binding protein [Leptolyngbya sp. SIO1D8]